MPREILTRNAVLLPALAALTAAALWLTFLGFREPGPSDGVVEIERPRYHIDNADWMRYDAEGAPLFEVRAASVDYYDDASAQLMDVDVQRLGGEQGAWDLHADHGSVAAGETRLVLKPQVVVNGNPPQHDEIVLRTTQLWVDWDTRMLGTAERIVAESPNRSLQAVGMRSDWAGERVQFLRDVEVHHAPAR